MRNFFKLHMPYAMQRLSGNNRWILLNRYYKPLGEPDDIWIDYETHPSVFTRGFLRKTLLGLSCHTTELYVEHLINHNKVYLYEGELMPVYSARYINRLVMLDKYLLKS